MFHKDLLTELQVTLEIVQGGTHQIAASWVTHFHHGWVSTGASLVPQEQLDAACESSSDGGEEILWDGGAGLGFAAGRPPVRPEAGRTPRELGKCVVMSRECPVNV